MQSVDSDSQSVQEHCSHRTSVCVLLLKRSMARFLWVFITFWFCSTVCISTATLSGLYLDNGIDQTVMQHVMTRQEKEEVEHEILHLLGLPDRPRARVRSVSTPLESSAPKFLLDVYKSLLEPSVNRAPRSEFNLSGRDLHAIDESDVIMSFTSQNHHEAGVRHERGKRLWFDVSEVPVGESIVGGELRLYQIANSIDSAETYTITLFQVVASADDGEKELEYVDAVNTTSDNEGWLLINLTSPLASWVAFPDSNLGLYMSVHQPNRPSHEIHPEVAGIVGTKGEEERRPFMVAFLKASNRRESRRVRATKEAPKRSKKANSSTDNYTRNTYVDPTVHWSSRSCQIQTLYVSFRDLEWQDWIIAPDGYGAFYCSGECNFPLNAHMNATNHAIVQTLVHLMNPTHVPKPCCAPTKLTPISVLYFLDDTNVILKKYKNMVVKSCGCH